MVTALDGPPARLDDIGFDPGTEPERNEGLLFYSFKTLPIRFNDRSRRAACRSRCHRRSPACFHHTIPHRLDLDEITWLVREYGESAALAAEAGADAIELHSNHDDVLQWFLSPRTNRRDDGYGIEECAAPVPSSTTSNCWPADRGEWSRRRYLLARAWRHDGDGSRGSVHGDLGAVRDPGGGILHRHDAGDT